MSKGDTFCDQLRKSTREIHAVSDALVNAKLALGLHNNKVWADGLLVFFEIFKFLENAINQDAELGRFHELCELKRTKAFQDDLNYYLGSNWTSTYHPRPSVLKYLSHLQQLKENNPILLSAYVYHLYMGLLSGGQILRRKKQMFQFVVPQGTENIDGNHVTDFGNRNIYNIKSQIRKEMNDLSKLLDDETKELILEESKVVFTLNNELVRSVEGAGIAILQKVIIGFIICIIILMIFKIVFH